MINDRDPLVAAVSLRSASYASAARADRLRGDPPAPGDEPTVRRHALLVVNFEGRATLLQRCAVAAEACGSVPWWTPEAGAR